MSVRDLIFRVSGLGDEILLQSQLMQCDREDINAPDNDGNTPVWLTWKRDHDMCVSLLIAAGADISVCNSNGDTPMYLAAYHSQLDTLLLLIKHGVNVVVYDGRIESLSYVYGRMSICLGPQQGDDILILTDAAKLEDVATIEDAYRQQIM